MVDDPHELILDHLRAIRQDLSEAKRERAELKDAVLAGREDVNSLRGDVLRIERGLAAVEVDVDRIKVRLDLSDFPKGEA